MFGPGDLDTTISFASWKVALCSSSRSSLSVKLSVSLLRRVSTSMCNGSTRPLRRLARSLNSDSTAKTPLLSILLGAPLSRGDGDRSSGAFTSSSAVWGLEEAVVTISGTSVIRFSSIVEKAVWSMVWSTPFALADSTSVGSAVISSAFTSSAACLSSASLASAGETTCIASDVGTLWLGSSDDISAPPICCSSVVASLDSTWSSVITSTSGSCVVDTKSAVGADSNPAGSGTISASVSAQ